MAKRVQLRRGTTAQTNVFTGAVGEVTVDTTKKVVVVHDGVTAGGTPLLKASDVPSASETVQGKIEIATQTEVNTGTDTTRAVTPQTLLLGINNHLNVTGNAPMFACRAWVNFNGTGTVAIRASGNVSSITDNGVGNYTINFSSPMPDTNYAVAGFAVWGDAQAAGLVSQTSGYAPSVNSIPIRTVNANSGSGFYDPTTATVIVVR